MLLALLGREVPELPCNVLFNPMECEEAVKQFVY
jgi:hypothetical protein